RRRRRARRRALGSRRRCAGSRGASRTAPRPPGSARTPPTVRRARGPAGGNSPRAGRRRSGPRRYRRGAPSCELGPEPRRHPLPPRADVAGQAVTPLRPEPRQHLAPGGDVAPLALGLRRELARPRAAAVVDERRAHDEAAPAALAHGEREVAVEAVVEAVALVEAADRLQEGARQAHADRVHDRHLLPGGTYGRPLGEAVHDRAANVAPAPPQALDAVEPGEPRAGLGEGADEPREP